MKKEVEPVDYRYYAQEIRIRLDFRDLVPEHARGILAETLELLPKDIIDFAVDNLTFISMDGPMGAYFSLQHYALKDRIGFILLGRNLWKRGRKYIAYVIAHEIAHAYKGHNLSDFDRDADSDRNRECDREADEFALEWLSRCYSKKSLIKYTYEGSGVWDAEFKRGLEAWAELMEKTGAHDEAEKARGILKQMDKQTIQRRRKFQQREKKQNGSNKTTTQ